MKNQEELNAFKAWLVALPNIYDEGFYESAVDIPNRKMTLLWHGNSDLQGLAVAEGGRRELTVTIKHVPYTRASVIRATQQLTDPANRSALQGLNVSWVAGPTLENDALTVAGTYGQDDAQGSADFQSRAPAFAAAAKTLTGLDLAVVHGERSHPYVARSTDWSPFNAGGLMRGSDGTWCTSGFGVRRNGYTWVTTASHCVASSWTAWDDGNSSYGFRSSSDGNTGTRLLTGDASALMFDGPWDSSYYVKTVWGWATVSQGSVICSSGANSGVHCNLTVDNTNESFYDGYTTFSTIRVHAQSGIAGAEGDSGGPMLIPASDGVHVYAVGTLQGSQETQHWCGSNIHLPGNCSEYVEFSPITDFLSDMGADLVYG
jgi:hypothetical protein